MPSDYCAVLLWWVFYTIATAFIDIMKQVWPHAAFSSYEVTSKVQALHFLLIET